MILPVVVGGLGHVVVLKADLLRALTVPIDGGARWQERPVFGRNKTWRGLVVMTGLTALASGTQEALARRSRRRWALAVRPSAPVNATLAGAICGLTYCLAELPNSFIKRRLGVAPGGRAQRAHGLQYVIDQADSVVGGLLPMRLLYGAGAGELFTAVVLGMSIHIGIDQLIYAIGVKSHDTKS